MKTGVIAVLILVGILVIAGGIFLFSNTYQAPTNTGNSENTAGNQVGNPSAGTGAKTYNIDIKSFAFNPSTLTINVGDTVIWTNKDSASHTVTSNSGSELNSQTLNGGSGTYSHTFATAGTYVYHCAIHTSMKGTIVVQ